jgi:hypothetical protein
VARRSKGVPCIGGSAAAWRAPLALCILLAGCGGGTSRPDPGSLPNDLRDAGSELPDAVGPDVAREVAAEVPPDLPPDDTALADPLPGDPFATDPAGEDAPVPGDGTALEVEARADPGPDAAAACPAFGDATVRGRLEGGELLEASGLAASRRDPGVLWAHNDSGNAARLFALRADGTIAGRFDLAGITPGDWEDIARGPFAGLAGDALFVADTGDNLAVRASVTVHVLAEPVIGDLADPVEVPVLASLELAYPDGPVDCESLFVDPATGDLYLVAKEVRGDLGSRLFRKRAPHRPSAGVTVLEEAGSIPVVQATAADVSPDGSVLVVRTYFGGVLVRRAPGQDFAEAAAGESCELPPFPDEPQGEAIALLPDGSGFVTVSESAYEVPQDLRFTALSWAMPGS